MNFINSKGCYRIGSHNIDDLITQWQQVCIYHFEYLLGPWEHQLIGGMFLPFKIINYNILGLVQIPPEDLRGHIHVPKWQVIIEDGKCYWSAIFMDGICTFLYLTVGVNFFVCSTRFFHLMDFNADHGSEHIIIKDCHFTFQGISTNPKIWLL